MSDFQAPEVALSPPPTSGAMPSALEPPPTSLGLDPNWLTPKGLIDWYICPWMAERANQLILPLSLDGQPFLLSWEGIACIPLLSDGPGHQVQGKTGKVNVNLRSKREGGIVTMQGNIGLQQVNYTIDFNQNPIPVEGATGRFRTNSRINLTDNGMSFDGESGRFTSRLVGTFEPGVLKFAGGKVGERTELEIVPTETGADFKGFFMGSSGDLSIKSAGNRITATGFVREKNCSYTVELAKDCVQMTGGGAPGELTCSVYKTPQGFFVKGRLNPGNHMNYHIRHQS